MAAKTTTRLFCDLCGKEAKKLKDYVGRKAYAIYSYVWATQGKRQKFCEECSAKTGEFLETLKAKAESEKEREEFARWLEETGDERFRMLTLEELNELEAALLKIRKKYEKAQDES